MKSRSDQVLIAFLISISGIAIVSSSIFYFSVFNSGLSNEQSVWGYFGSYFGGTISPILSFCSFVMALYIIRKNSQEERFNHIYDFMKDYRSAAMSKDLKLLWDFYSYRNYKERLGKYDDEKLNKKEELKKNYPKEHENASEIYLARRNVSFFYLYLSIFLRQNRLNESILFDLWPEESLNTLRDIIIPCEESISPNDKPNKLYHFTYLIDQAKQFKKKTQKA